MWIMLDTEIFMFLLQDLSTFLATKTFQDFFLQYIILELILKIFYLSFLWQYAMSS